MILEYKKEFIMLWPNLCLPVVQMYSSSGSVASLGHNSSHRPSFLQQQVSPYQDILHYAAAHSVTLPGSRSFQHRCYITIKKTINVKFEIRKCFIFLFTKITAMFCVTQVYSISHMELYNATNGSFNG